MAASTETRVARCESCGEFVPLSGNTIRLWDSAPPAQVGADGEVVLAPAPAVGWLLVCPECRQRTRISDIA